MLYNRENISLKKQIIKRVKTILIPYWLLSFIYILIHLALGLLKNSNWQEKLVNDIYYTISGLGIGTLWFLPTIFGAEIIFIFAKKTFKHYREFLAICFVPSVFLCNLIYKHFLNIHKDTYIISVLSDLTCVMFQIIIAVCAMAVGTYIWSFVNLIQKYKYKSICFVACAMLLIAVDISLWRFYIGNDLHLAKITESISYIICTITSVAAVFCFSKVFVHIKCVNEILSYFGKNSFIIMTTHLEYRMVDLSEFIAISLFGTSLLCKLLSLPILCIVEVIICIIVNKTFLKKIFGMGCQIKSGTN